MTGAVVVAQTQLVEREWMCDWSCGGCTNTTGGEGVDG